MVLTVPSFWLSWSISASVGPAPAARFRGPPSLCAVRHQPVHSNRPIMLVAASPSGARSSSRCERAGRARAACWRSSASRGSARRRCSSTPPSVRRGDAGAPGARDRVRGADPVRARCWSSCGPALGRSSRSRSPRPPRSKGRSRCDPGAAQERFAVGAATLSLLAAYAEKQPGRGADRRCPLARRSSAQALLFALRRLHGGPDRGVDRRPRGRAVAARRRRPRTLAIDRPDADARRSRCSRASRPRPPRRLHEATAGNPLALLELAADAERAGAGARGCAGAACPRASRRAFLRRVTESSTEPTRRRAGARGDERQRRARACSSAQPARSGSTSPRWRPPRTAGLVTLRAGLGRVPPSAGPFGDLRRRACRRAPAQAHRALAGGAPRPRCRPTGLAPGVCRAPAPTRRRPPALEQAARAHASAAPMRARPPRSSAPRRLTRRPRAPRAAAARRSRGELGRRPRRARHGPAG